MATVIHILLALIAAVLSAIIQAFLVICSRALTAILALALLITGILFLTGALTTNLFHRRK